MLAKSAVRVAILYVTDGDVRNYREDFNNPVINSSDSHDLSRRFPETLVQEKIAKLDAVLSARQTPVFIVDLNQHTDRLNEAYHNGLKQLAETSGGAAFFARSITEIPASIHNAFESVQSHYSLTSGSPRACVLEVADPAHGSRWNAARHLSRPPFVALKVILCCQCRNRPQPGSP